MKIAVGIATAGRSDLLSLTVREIAKQNRLPDCLFVCPARVEDFDQGLISDLPFPTRVVSSAVGLTKQRNAILKELVGYDAIAFFDDDFFPHLHYLACAEHVLDVHEDVVVLTGDVLADGAKGQGILPNEARRIIEQLSSSVDNTGKILNVFSAYGCNMVIRLNPILKAGIQFDERLPLYGWLEDMDFSRKAAVVGKIASVPGMKGVHLALKSGRNSGRRYGYSQIVNPIYLWRKGLVPWQIILSHAGKNLLANSWRAFSAESYIDRKGRLSGNARALFDVARGIVEPERIVDM